MPIRHLYPDPVHRFMVPHRDVFTVCKEFYPFSLLCSTPQDFMPILFTQQSQLQQNICFTASRRTDNRYDRPSDTSLRIIQKIINNLQVKTCLRNRSYRVSSLRTMLQE